MSENKKMSLGKKVLIGLGIFLVLGIIANMGNDSETKTVNTTKKKNNPEKEIQAIKISAEDLFAEYEKNGVAADNKFKGKEIEVNGEIESIDKDILDELYVNLKGDEIGMLGIQCYFKDKNNNDLSNLKKGDSVTRLGMGNGKTINVTLKKCRLKK